MRVLHFLGSLNRRAGGVAAFVADVAEAVAAAGADVTVATRDAVDVPEAWGTPGFPRVRVSAADGDAGALPGAAVRGADVVHLHGPWERQNAAVAAACRSGGVPYVVSLHGMIDRWSMNNGLVKVVKKRIYLATTARKMLEAAAFVHCTAEAETQAAASFLPRARFTVLPCVVEPGDLAAIARQVPAGEEGSLRVLFLSRLHEKKRPDLLISTLPRVPGVQLTLAGPGEDDYVDRLNALASRLGVKERVSLPGMLRGPERIAAYAAAGCFALPTSQENFGIVLAEAMAAGLPTVTTRGTAIWRELEAAGAWIVDQDVSAIASALEAVAADCVAAHERALRGRSFVLAEYAAKRLGPRYLGVYEEALRLRNGRL